MKNELTILRFHGTELAMIPPVSPGTVFAISECLRDLLAKAAQTLGFSEVRTELIFATSPRRGSLEIVFVHVAEVSALTSSGGGVASELTSKLVDAASIGSFLWVVLFGGRGVVDWVRSSRNPGHDPIPTAENDLRAQAVDLLARGVEIREAAQKLLDAAIVRTARQVEIEVTDEPPVLLFAADDRRQSTLLARAKREGHNPANAGVKAIVRVGGQVVEASFGGERVSVFVGTGAGPTFPSGERLVIVWASKAALPTPGASVEVKSEALNGDALKRVEFEEAIPFEFEDAQGVLLVKSASTWS
ncbi:MAG: hypothetical protein EOP94_02425 [Zymomonas sp.]|nr:MAG: hypothetical protein EOP94_02425 [Zymomonas sp.]